MQTTKASSAKTVDGLPLEKVQVLAIGLKAATRNDNAAH